MANVEDDAEFGSHFLDSMLEVEMTEEDGELDVTKNENFTGEHARALPPIPTFDLQSETLTYKDIYRGSAVQPSLSTTDRLPSAGQQTKSSPMLTIYSRDLLPAPVSSTSAKVNPPKISLKPTIKPKTFTKPIPFSEEILATQFLQQVFRPEYVKNVFIKKDTPLDMSQTSEEEMEYYKTCFKDLSKIKYCRLHCTICDKHLGCSVNVEKKLTVHSMLKVLTCKACFEFYGDGNFPCDKGDNCEIYCRWCGQGGALVCCSFCPRVFCKRCVKRNFGPGFLRSIEKASDWACFCCAQKPLWPHRAICRALMEYIVLRKSDSKILQKDITKCCSASTMDKRKIKPLDKNKIMVPQGEVKISAACKNIVTHSNLKNKLILPVKTNSRKEQSILKSNFQIRLSDQNKNITPVKLLNKNTVPKLATNILSSRSLLTGSNVVQNLSANDKIKRLSTFSSPQLIQRPVLHGETIITPPGSRMLMAQKTGSNPNLGNSFVRVSLTNQTSNLDISKIPTAKIPHDVQGLILRMSFPDKRVQLVRLVSDGNECKTAKDFPMPEFKKSDDLTFVEENLADSFKLSKMIYDQLMVIKEKVNLKSKFTEESVFTSSVKKLHFIYEKSIELLKGLDQSLLENFEQWKNQIRSPLDVIDLSDEEGKITSGKIKHTGEPSFMKKCKESLQNDDSDIEILDHVTSPSPNLYDNKCNKNKARVVNNLMNNDTYKSMMAKNFKEKYRLRNSLVERLKKKNIASNRKKPGRKVRRKRKVNTLKKAKNHDEKNDSLVKSLDKIENITLSQSEVEKSFGQKSFEQGDSPANSYKDKTDTRTRLKVSQENLLEQTFEDSSRKESVLSDISGASPAAKTIKLGD